MVKVGTIGQTGLLEFGVSPKHRKVEKYQKEFYHKGRKNTKRKYCVFFGQK